MTMREYLTSEVEELLKLPAWWDSYMARPINRDNAMLAVDAVCALLEKQPKPHVIPLNDGGVEFEWPGIGVEIQFPGSEFQAMPITIMEEADDA